jgi:hypothetical protein
MWPPKTSAPTNLANALFLIAPNFIAQTTALVSPCLVQV